MSEDLRKIEAMLEAGDLESAEEKLKALLERVPSDARVIYLYGELLLRIGQVDQALEYLRQAISSENSDPCWLVMGAVALQNRGRYVEAENAFKAAEMGGCRSDRFYYFSGNFHTNITRRFEQAEYCYARLLEQNPDAHVGWVALSRLYNLQQRYDESIQAAETSLGKGHESSEVFNNLGAGLSHQGRQSEALACYARALEIDPGCETARQNYLQQLLFTEEDQVEIHRRVRELVSPLNARSATGFSHSPKPGTRIRLGFVSADLYFHAIGFYLKPIIESLDRDRFEITMYYNNVIEDAVTHQIRTAAAHWRECLSLSDDELAAQIRADGIDILVDLSNHTAGNRLGAFINRPAPVQIAWMGLPVSTGLDCMDYWIRDSRMLLQLEDGVIASEALLPVDDLIVYDSIQELPALSPPPLLQNGYVTFGYYNGLRKATDQLFEVWGGILKRVEESRIRVVIDDYDNTHMQDHLYDRFASLGISRERVQLQGRLPMQEYLSAYNEIDIALDPFPYNGQTTTMNALQMGVPVVTCRGNALASLYGAAVLERLGKPEWIASDLKQYATIAVSLARNTAELEQVRFCLRDQVTEAFGSQRGSMVKSLEQTLTSVWTRYLDRSSSLSG